MERSVSIVVAILGVWLAIALAVAWAFGRIVRHNESGG